ncbi:ScaI family restriction endonuclease [Calothrix sp. UHCC 0171]|uniref:ScaI family restriction endonuclease n=1 Tax=Calothrix sp. UHCC 0171 TaxID=3110245 RepID=UPI002B20BD04|nr:ScaI family restriction endonuclease [Calothrix sp. UHCC 0171]MEA5571217.1 ScaI family restriction endonuclease [Calothrix sp. UHCC 0171]
MSSPYNSLGEEEWLAKTQDLVDQHPLDFETIRRVALKCWDTLWSTKIGEGELSISLWELDVPAIVIGYFFEKLFAKELETEHPCIWRGGKSKDDKDIVYIPNNFYSIEIKSSGQLGVKVFGNRSYGQNVENSELEKKEKSGYYITVNFYERTLSLLRFGWIDHEDWKAQKAATGQAAGLGNSVYKYKLLEIDGDYRLDAPIGIVKGIGSKTSKDFSAEGVQTIRDLQNYQGRNSKILKFKDKFGEYET